MLWCKRSETEVFSNPHRSHIKPIYSKVKKQLSLFQAIDSLKLVALIDGFDSNIKSLNEVLEFSHSWRRASGVRWLRLRGWCSRWARRPRISGRRAGCWRSGMGM